MVETRWVSRAAVSFSCWSSVMSVAQHIRVCHVPSISLRDEISAISACFIGAVCRWVACTRRPYLLITNPFSNVNPVSAQTVRYVAVYLSTRKT